MTIIQAFEKITFGGFYKLENNNEMRPKSVPDSYMEIITTQVKL